MPKTLRSPPHSTPLSPQTVTEQDKKKLFKRVCTRKERKQQLMTSDDVEATVSGDEMDTFSALRNEMRDLFDSMKIDQKERLDALEKRFTDFERRFDLKISSIQDSNNNVEKSVDFFADQLKDIQSKIASYETGRKELSTHIALLDEKCDVLEHSLRKPCLEIRNVPKKHKETKNDLYASILGLTKSLNMSLELVEVRDIYRIPVRTSKDCSTIIVELCNTLAKEKILQAVKNHNRVNRDNPLNSSSLGLDGLRTTIYISEYLSSKNKRLYYLAREFAKLQNYAFCWTSSGRVYLRKKDGDPYLLVKSETQLKDLVLLNKA